mgnify:CR=1 FL=1
MKKITIIGGDLRIAKLAELLSEDGFEIKTFALDKAENLNKIEKIKKCSSIEEAIKEAELIIGPIPLSSNGRDINTPFSETIITIEELFSKLDNKKFIAGSIKQELIEKYSKVNILDIMEREELAVLNTISTAEGAIQIAMEETTRTLHGSKVLVMGFGRVGKILSNMLKGIGAQVYCEARKDTDLAWIKAYGYNSIHLKELDNYLNEFDIIINTIPVTILNEEKLKKLKEDTLIIDLASNPGGVDKLATKKLGIKLIWALSLPGKVAPITSAEFIKDTLFNIIKEM